MKRIILIACFLISLSLWGQVPEFEWVGAFGGNIHDAAYDVTTDKWGNVYTTGGFRLIADADFGSDEHLLQAGSDSDIYIAKYAPDRTLLWAHCFSGGYDGSAGIALAADTMGYVYLLTNIDFYSYVDFDPGSGVSAISTDETQVGIILKLTSDGDFVWVKNLGGEEPLAQVSPTNIALDEKGNIFITGIFNHNPDFDPGDETYLLLDNGFGSIFVSKLTEDGNFVWARSLGGALEPGDDDYSLDLAVDTTGNVYITGSFQSDAIYPDTLFEVTSMSLNAIGETDMFIAKFADTGAFLWAKSIGDELSMVTGNGVVVDDDQNIIYISGSFNGVVDFDSGSSQVELSATGLREAYILKLNTFGDFIGVTSTNGQLESSCFSTGLAFSNDSNLCVIGQMNGTIDFDPYFGEYLVSNEHASFVWMVDTLLENKWVVSFGGATNGSQGGIVSSFFGRLFNTSIDHWGNIYSSGVFQDTVDFNPGSNVEQVASISTDAFLHKMRQYPCTSDVVSIENNDTLTICSGESLDLYATLLGGIHAFSYKWSTADTDSTIIISPTTESMYSVEVYHSPACISRDTILIQVAEIPDTLYLAENTCDSMYVGTFSDSLVNLNGCDTIVITHVSLTPSSEIPIIQASMIIEQGTTPFTVTIEEVLDAISYVWSVPPGMQILSGQGTNIVTVSWDSPELAGNICVASVNECGVESQATCMEVIVEIVDAVSEYEKVNFKVFPNPVDEILHIVSNHVGDNNIILYNSLGESLRILSNQQQQTQIYIKDLPEGIYYLTLSSRQLVLSEKILIAH